MTKVAESNKHENKYYMAPSMRNKYLGYLTIFRLELFYISEIKPYCFAFMNDRNSHIYAACVWLLANVAVYLKYQEMDGKLENNI